MENRIGKLWYGLLATLRLRAAEYIVMTLTAK